jgi:hypothetical protein
LTVLLRGVSLGISCIDLNGLSSTEAEPGKAYMKSQLLRAPLIAACTLLFVLLVAPAAQATDASVTPVTVEDNPKCADFGVTAITKFDPVESGTQDGITLTKHDGVYVRWTSTSPSTG